MTLKNTAFTAHIGRARTHIQQRARIRLKPCPLFDAILLYRTSVLFQLDRSNFAVSSFQLRPVFSAVSSMEKYERRSPHGEVQAAPRHHHGRGTRRHPLRRHARRLLLRQGRTAATTAVNLEGKALNIYCGAGMTKPFQEIAVDWQHLFGRFREGQPRFPELDRRHVARRRVDPEVVVPVRVVRELGP